MREQFQKAFCDLTASADFVKRVRVNPDLLSEQYDLSEIELRRLIVMVNQRGMECNCILYRANRLAPIVINLPEVCTLLDKQLRSLLSEYWVQTPSLSDNFWVDADDFCEFVKKEIDAGRVASEVRQALDREQSVVVQQLSQIFPEKYASRSSSGSA